VSLCISFSFHNSFCSNFCLGQKKILSIKVVYNTDKKTPFSRLLLLVALLLVIITYGIKWRVIFDNKKTKNSLCLSLALSKDLGFFLLLKFFDRNFFGKQNWSTLLPLASKSGRKKTLVDLKKNYDKRHGGQHGPRIYKYKCVDYSALSKQRE